MSAGADGIDDNVELHLIDTSKLIEESRKIHKARDLRKQAESEVKKLAQSVSPLANLSKDDIVKNILGVPSSGKGTPKGFFEGGAQTFKSAVSGARTDNSFRALQEKVSEQEQELDDIKRQKDTDNKQHIKDLEDAIKDFKQKQKDLEKEQREFQEKVTGKFQAFGVVTSTLSSGNAGPLAGILFRLGRFGFIGALIAGALTEISNVIVQQTERGGAFSTKLKHTKQAVTLNDVEDDNAYRAGTKYITSDMRIVQRAPETSNTANIKFEAIRYTLDNLGKQ